MYSYYTHISAVAFLETATYNYIGALGVQDYSIMVNVLTLIGGNL